MLYPASQGLRQKGNRKPDKGVYLPMQSVRPDAEKHGAPPYGKSDKILAWFVLLDNVSAF
jgi:hypothetical protein